MLAAIEMHRTSIYIDHTTKEEEKWSLWKKPCLNLQYFTDFPFYSLQIAYIFRNSKIFQYVMAILLRICLNRKATFQFGTLYSRPLLKRAAAVIRFLFFSKRLHCVKVLLQTALKPELLIWKLELSSIVGLLLFLRVNLMPPINLWGNKLKPKTS